MQISLDSKRPEDDMLGANFWTLERSLAALVRTARRLPVEALGESGVLVTVTGYPRGGAPGPVLYPGYQKSKRNLVYGIGSQ